MTQSSRAERVAALFDAVIDLDEESRSALLDAADPELSGEVGSLLSALERGTDWLEPSRTETLDGVDGPIRRIGAYRLLRCVGRGGMGAVYEAERADATYVKRVAIKLIRDDVGGKEISRRFARERAILAGLEHPNISRMLDGGTLEDGREYLVMEFVDGVPITTWCNSHDASIRERLALFLQVCDAVQFSHQHLVVHGDIKPGNLLVTGDGGVKLVDFGVAKVVDEADSRTRDPLTALGALTPAYASPEQWRGESLSMLSDVYSLGVVLYELLVGTRPFTIDSRTTTDVLQSIEAGARRPSAAVLSHAEARRLSRALTGELDTIVLTALDASAKRRYQSVERLADDVRRHLDGRLVLAQPATRRYRVSKFLKRYRGSVAAGTALALALLGGGLVATVQARRANQQRAVAERISGFLKQMLASPDATWINAGKADVRVADVLDAAAAQADTLRSDPAAEAMVRRTIGAAYRALNRYDEADRQLKLALALDLKRDAPSFPDLADDYHELAWARYARGDWQTALGYYDEANRHCGGNRAADTSIVCFKVGADYGLALTTRGRLVEAESLYLDVVRRGKLRFGENAAPLSVIYGNLGFIADIRGDLARGEAMHRLALAAWRTGPQPSERPLFYHSLALNQLLQGKVAAARQAVEEGLRSVAETNGERSFPAMALYVDGAAARRRSLDSSGARAYLARAREAIPPNVSKMHPNATNVWIEDGLQHVAAGDPVAAESLFRDAERVRGSVYVATDPRFVRASGLVGIALAAQGRYDDGAGRLRAALTVFDSVYPPGFSLTRELRGALALTDSARASGEPVGQAARRFAKYIVERP